MNLGNGYAKRGCIALLFMSVVFQLSFAAEQTSHDDSPRLLSAFFGLDNRLPFRANVLCLGASGKDGMPVVFSHTLDSDSIQAEDFEVITRGGAKHTPDCVTLRPAEDAGELRTVLLIGEFGNADDDPPKTVHAVGELFSDGNQERVNFRGASVEVIPLSAGPSLILAERIPVANLSSDTRGSTCPDGVAQVVRVTWTGGVRLPNGEDPSDKERKLYRVTVERKGGELAEITPIALGDLGDGDNNHLLCLDTVDPAVAIDFPGGIFVDPNQDLNPATQVSVSQGVY